MKVLVCGSRDWRESRRIAVRLSLLPPDTLVLHGAARGADLVADGACMALGLRVHAFPPDYRRWPKKVAPLKRNLAMLDEQPDLVIAFQRNGSRGTQHTIDEARRRGIPVEVHTGAVREK
jgi:hypothetical protein